MCFQDGQERLEGTSHKRIVAVGRHHHAHRKCLCVQDADRVIRRTKGEQLATWTAEWRSASVRHVCLGALNATYLASKQVSPLSLTLRTLVTCHVSVSHLHTKARRGDDFVRVRGGTVFKTVYKTFSSCGWYLYVIIKIQWICERNWVSTHRAARKLLPASLPGSVGRSMVFSSSSLARVDSFFFP